MSDLLRTLSRQLSRSQQGAGAIRPRGRSRFEPYGDGPSSFPSGLAFDEAEHAAPFAQPGPIQANVSPQPRAEQGPRMETLHVAQPEREQSPATATPIREMIREVIRSVDPLLFPVLLAREPQAAQGPAVPVAWREREAAQPIPPASISGRAPAVESQGGPQPPVVRTPVPADEPRSARTSSQPAERLSIAPLAQRSLPRFSEGDFVRSRVPAAQAFPQAAQPAGRQEITIEIGSIIVHGDASERRTPHSIAAAPPQAPALSLERYLQHRGGTR
ncbi:hypothetical protein AciX9_2460 [Granulicella tundricola MP5ACTX9]|uniref:Uncharacterized protein n=1 Tax=Granulicella tundricola (strain ATCC BAA-1859 / DSM 23138 / MP5ACTX9) TaxID=1198114 RepID=E8X5E8_GRATM|nr:hypothetical protein AciX9_2460 [Granulicella tundricola MP5ACTX9]